MNNEKEESSFPYGGLLGALAGAALAGKVTHKYANDMLPHFLDKTKKTGGVFAGLTEEDARRLRKELYDKYSGLGNIDPEGAIKGAHKELYDNVYFKKMLLGFMPEIMAGLGAIPGSIMGYNVGDTAQDNPAQGALLAGTTLGGGALGRYLGKKPWVKGSKSKEMVELPFQDWNNETFKEYKSTAADNKLSGVAYGSAVGNVLGNLANYFVNPFG